MLGTASKQDIRFPSYEFGDSMLFFNCVWDYPEICLELLQSRLSDFLQMNLEIVRCSLTVYGIFQVRTQILKSEYFPSGMNNWLIRALLYSQYFKIDCFLVLMGNAWDCFKAGLSDFLRMNLEILCCSLTVYGIIQK